MEKLLEKLQEGGIEVAIRYDAITNRYEFRITKRCPDDKTSFTHLVAIDTALISVWSEAKLAEKLVRSFDTAYGEHLENKYEKNSGEGKWKRQL